MLNTPPTADDIRSTVEARLRESEANSQDHPILEVRLCSADRELLQRIERSPILRAPMSTILWGVAIGAFFALALAALVLISIGQAQALR